MQTLLKSFCPLRACRPAWAPGLRTVSGAKVFHLWPTLRSLTSTLASTCLTPRFRFAGRTPGAVFHGMSRDVTINVRLFHARRNSFRGSERRQWGDGTAP
jgi:hypothetical protein